MEKEYKMLYYISMRYFRLAAIYLLFCVFFSGCSSVQNAVQYTVPPVITEMPAPEVQADDYCFMDADGNTLHLWDLWGCPILLKFCSPDFQSLSVEMDAIQRAYEQYGKSIRFLMVFPSDYHHSASVFLKQNNYSFPFYIGLDSVAAKPSFDNTVFFIDSDGFIVTQTSGPMEEEALEFGLRLL